MIEIKLRLANTCVVFQERPRPEYAAKAPTYEKNPITGIKEPHFPPRKRLPRILSGIAVIIIMVRSDRNWFQFYEECAEILQSH